MDNTDSPKESQFTEKGKEAFTSVITDYGKLKKRLFISVMNAANEGFLDTVPHRNVENLSIIANIALDPEWLSLSEDKVPCVLVTYDIIRRFGMDPEWLLEDAHENSPELMPVEPPVPIEKFLHARETQCPGFILTNKENRKGAAVLFYPGVMEKCRDAIGSDYYILPTSVHEVLLMPVGYMEPETIASIVKGINADPDVVSPEDWLSDSVYLYSKEGGFSTAAAG